MHISVNGGVTSLEQAKGFLAAGLDGVMIGRAAYHQPGDILAAADPVIYGTGQVRDPVQVVHDMLPYIDAHLVAGGRLAQISRHMLGLFAGQPGARIWRRVLSEGAHKAGAGVPLVKEALDAVREARKGAFEAEG